jgi:hypothetical protein
MLLGGCASFMAGYRAPTVRSITLGMTTAGVRTVAGQPQRRDALVTPNGPVEVWYYVVPGPGGGLEEHPVVFANGQVFATGKEAVQTLGQAAANPPAQQPTEAQLYQAFVAAYLAGYRQGQSDRNAEWQEAINKAAPQVQQQLRAAEARGYAAGQKAGEQKAQQQLREAWDAYLREAEQKKREGLTF